MGYINTDHHIVDNLITEQDILKICEGVLMIPEIAQVQIARQLDDEKIQETTQQEKQQLKVQYYKKIQQIFEPPFIPYTTQETINTSNEIIYSFKEVTKTFCHIQWLNYLADTWEICGEEYWPLFIMDFRFESH